MKKTIFTQILCACILAAGFTSCKKDSNNPSASFKASFDGSEKVFSKASNAQRNVLGNYSLVITGITSNNETISLMLVSDQDFTVGASYSVATSPSNDLVYVGTDTNGWSASFAPTQDATKFDCTITEISSTEVKGTFSGDLYSSIDGSKMTVSNGAFSAKF
jgi:hypothetical protein